jgi:hypothetical protein
VIFYSRQFIFVIKECSTVAAYVKCRASPSRLPEAIVSIGHGLVIALTSRIRQYIGHAAKKKLNTQLPKKEVEGDYCNGNNVKPER